jgi:hypothetical protein
MAQITSYSHYSGQQTRKGKKMKTVFNHHVDDSLPTMIYNHALNDAAESNKYLCVSDEKKQGGKSISEKLGLFHYPGRVLGSTNPCDILQLHPNLKKHWDWIKNHYDRAGISYASEIIWDDNPVRMREFPDFEPSVFLFGDRAHKARPDKAWYEIVRDMNSKNNFIELCQKLGIPTPPTWCYDCKSMVENLEVFNFPVYLKIAVSVSGLGVVKCDDIESLQIQISLLDEDVPFQIQQGVEAFTFLNLQYRKNGKLERVAATEQVLKGNCHAGNAFPTNYQPWNLTDPIAEKMVENGMKGYFAFDIAVCREAEGIRYYAIECNPRYNGSSYPTNIARKLDAKQWIAKKIDTKFNSFDPIDLGGAEYDPKKGIGAVVVNWGCVSENELGMLLVAPSGEEQMRLEKKLKHILQ